ncbi:hypothetical protein D3C86_1716700 [compost metagenome]
MRTAHEVVVDVGVAPAGIEAAEYCVAAGHGLLHLLRVLHIGSHHAQAGARRVFLRIARQCHDLMAAVEQLVQKGRTDKTRATNQCDFHICSRKDCEEGLSLGRDAKLR